MILIADSGGTKTEWRILDEGGNTLQARTKGINPYYQEKEVIVEQLKTELVDYLDKGVKQIYFYGAGCSSESNKKTISDCFHSIYSDARVEVHSDLMAAARSLCGYDKGIACILGTGANSCLYDGNEILENVASLGYLLGDEGSGSYLGNRLLGQFMRGELPESISAKLVKRFDLTNDLILESVYQKEMPIRYMAGFSKFIFQNIKEPHLYKLVYDGFEIFFQKNILKYTDYQNVPVHFTGAVSFYFSNILRQVGSDLGITVKHIVEGPIAGLTLYHQKLTER